MSGILDKCVFVIDQYIPLRKKVELIRMIKSNGGQSVYSVSEKSTHLITSQEGFNEPSAKVAAATLQGLFIVSKEFVVDSITQGVKLAESNFFFTPGAIPTSPSSSPITSSSPPPILTVTIPPPRPANSPQALSSSSSSPLSPPGFTNLRAPSMQDKKGGFGRLRVDVNSKGSNSPQPSPSPKSPYSNSSSGIAASEEEEDDDDDDDDDDNDDSSDEDEPGKPSFKDVLEANKQARAWEAATPQYGAEDDGCKIFVGGIMFDDLEALKKTKDGYSASEEVIAHIQKLKNERLIEIIRIFSRFGTVVRVKQFLEKRHIFITYDNKQSALAALRTLKPLEVRKKIVQEVRERLRSEDRQTLVSPRSNFYVRWPHHVESEREDGGYSSASHSYFSGSSAPSSPTGISQPPSSKLNWRQQSPTSPTGNYQPYQRSYFTNNFTSAARSTSMRTYSRNSESDYENSNNPNSFSENESSQYSRQSRVQTYQHPHRTPDISPPKSAILSESDSDTPSGIRHRVVDRSIDRTDTTASTSTSSTTPHSNSSSLSPQQQQSTQQQQQHHQLQTAVVSSQPVATSALLNTTPSSTRAASPTHSAQQKRRAVNEEGNWHKVLVLLLVLASMAIVYLYNK